MRNNVSLPHPVQVHAASGSYEFCAIPLRHGSEAKQEMSRSSDGAVNIGAYSLVMTVVFFSCL